MFNNIDINLLKRYDKPGPRYTSYPSAPLFNKEYTTELYIEDLIKNNENNLNPISIYLHIPFCDTLCYFCGCTTIITPNQKHLDEYRFYLKKEISIFEKYYSKNRQVTQLHWGGGTPSYLNPDQIFDIGNFIKSRFNFSHYIEYGVEIDPRGLTFEHLEAFHSVGMNRISIGVQDFNEEVQRATNRIQPENITFDAIEWSRKLGIKSINLDLIYGLPKQTISSFEQTLDKVIDISPERIAVFNFAYVPWMKPHQKLINQNELPKAEDKLEILKMTIEKLTKAGYLYIGMDHFVKPDDEMAIAQKNKTLYRNFQGYSTNAGADLFGFGMSSISHFSNVYSQNHKSLESYYQNLDNNQFPISLGYRMNQDDIIRKYVIMKLMCDLEVNKLEVEQKFKINFADYFAESIVKLEEFKEQGIVYEDESKIIIGDIGRLILRNIAMCFDAYIDKLIKEKPIFSRTV
ncbi:MAG: Coproporphyrinogen III oxidase, oxygen-independent [Ignavibacteriae bacterium]|nr:MAG: Coproporphyrinogen III oxidase, oxygen-independent [Ignavibacteriota bacterium]